MKVKIVTLGCKVNTYESEYVLSKFKEKGYEIINDNTISDIYIINTCTVTNQSDAKSRKLINRAINENKEAIVVVMGCFIEANHDYNNDKVSIIIGNKDKSRVVELVEEYINNKKPQKLLYPDFDECFEDMYIKSMEKRTRAFVKIQDGCENFCSYCIIPYVRGKCRSKDRNEVLKEIKELVDNGYKEIVLTGIHTGNYGTDVKTTFPELLKSIVKIPKLERLRISSIEITELNDEFMEVLKNSSIIVNHIHIPLQSGSDIILKLMNRKYDTTYFYNKITSIRQIRPNISITTDIIVGFPNETNEIFQETYDFANKMKFTKIHVFPYSRRKNTKADKMDNQIDESIKKERVNKFISLSNQLEHEYLEKYIGKTVQVLVETNKNNISIGHTENYLQVEIQGSILHNTMVNVKIKKRENNYLKGVIE